MQTLQDLYHAYSSPSQTTAQCESVALLSDLSEQRAHENDGAVWPINSHGLDLANGCRVRQEETVLAGLKLLSQIFTDYLDAAHATASALRSVVDAVAFGLHSKHCQIATLGYGLLQQALLHGQLNRVEEQMQPTLGTVRWIWHADILSPIR